MRARIQRLRPSVRRGLLVLAVVGGVLVGGAVVDLIRVAAHLNSGKETVEDLSLDAIRADGIDGVLHSAADDFDDARRIANSSPFLSFWEPMPIAGNQVHGIQNLADAAAELGDEAAVTGDTIAAALDDAGGAPAARLLLVDTVLQELDRIEEVAAGIDLGGGDGLLGPVANAHRSLDEALDSVPGELAPLRRQTRAVRALLDGPTSYLLMGGNNAEMRAGAGMPLQIGTIDFARGDISISDLVSATAFLFEPNPTGDYNADISPDLRATYPNWLIGKDFPETAVVPDFPRTGPIFADIGADTAGWETEGVIHVDAIALAQLLDVVGPITIDGVEYSAETAPQLVLNQTYIDFDGVPRSQRRDAQSDLATAIFESIQSEDLDILDLVSALQRAARGRHLMVWSRHEVLQDLFVSLGLAGDVHPLNTLVSLQNTSANKLDWYIRPSVEVNAEQDADGWAVEMRVTVDHPDRDYTVPYIEGPYDGLDDGDHRALLTVQVPPVATELQIDGRPVTEFGFDGESNVIGTRFVTDKGTTEEVVVHYRLPPEMNWVAVLPSARVAPVQWTVNGEIHNDALPFVARFGEFDAPLSQRARSARLAAGLLAGLGAILAAFYVRRRGMTQLTGPSAIIDISTATAMVLAAGVLALVAGAF